MNSRNPWEDISVPEQDYNVRLIAGSGKIPLYWGRDCDGCCLFVVQLDAGYTNKLRKEDTSIRGIEIDLRDLGTTNRQGLVLALGQHVDRDLFYGLCETLVTSLTGVQDTAAAFSITLTHLKRWRAFLAGKNPPGSLL